MEHLPSLAQTAIWGLVFCCIGQTVFMGITFGYFVWKNLSQVNGVPPEFARRRFDLEERKMKLEETTTQISLEMRAKQMELSAKNEAKAEQHMMKLQALRGGPVPGVNAGLINPERG